MEDVLNAMNNQKYGLNEPNLFNPVMAMQQMGNPFFAQQPLGYIQPMDTPYAPNAWVTPPEKDFGNRIPASVPQQNAATDAVGILMGLGM